MSNNNWCSWCDEWIDVDDPEQDEPICAICKTSLSVLLDEDEQIEELNFND